MPAARCLSERESERGGWIEFLDPALEGFLELRVVLLRVLTGELDDFAIAVSGLFVLTASLVHHAQAIATIVNKLGQIWVGTT